MKGPPEPPLISLLQFAKGILEQVHLKMSLEGKKGYIENMWGKIMGIQGET